VVVDRDSASTGHHPEPDRLHLYDAFGQRLVSTILQPAHQYHVVMEVLCDRNRTKFVNAAPHAHAITRSAARVKRGGSRPMR